MMMIIFYNGIRNVLFLFLPLQYDDDYNGVRDVLSLFLLLQHNDDYDDVRKVLVHLLPLQHDDHVRNVYSLSSFFYNMMMMITMM